MNILRFGLFVILFEPTTVHCHVYAIKKIASNTSRCRCQVIVIASNTGDSMYKIVMRLHLKL